MLNATPPGHQLRAGKAKSEHDQLYGELLVGLGQDFFVSLANLSQANIFSDRQILEQIFDKSGDCVLAPGRKPMRLQKPPSPAEHVETVPGPVCVISV